MKVVIATDNASMRMSGETALPLYYFDRLRNRGIEVWMVCHERVEAELRERYPDEQDIKQITFVKDSLLQSLTFRWSRWLPFRIRDLIIGQFLHWLTQQRVRPVVQQLVEAEGIDLVFQPTPIAPKSVSCMHGLGVPVVIGPMCGGMTFPPAFQYLESPMDQISTSFGRLLADLATRVIPGKLQADVLLVANDRTAKALPRGCRGTIHQVIESGVDLSLWHPRKPVLPEPGQPTRFVYMARFVDQKGIPFLIEAFQQVAARTNSVLELIGDGELFESTKAQIAALHLQDRVNLHGRLPLEVAAALIRECDVYMVPAIRDCGGCAMLEAMAMGMPVIAANWAGPGQYADPSCGILVDLDTKEGFVNGLADAMIQLAESPERRLQMGQASLQRIRTQYFDWDAKVDRVLEIFEDLLKTRRQQVLPPLREPIALS